MGEARCPGVTGQQQPPRPCDREPIPAREPVRPYEEFKVLLPLASVSGIPSSYCSYGCLGAQDCKSTPSSPIPQRTLPVSGRALHGCMSRTSGKKNITSNYDKDFGTGAFCAHRGSFKSMKEFYKGEADSMELPASQRAWTSLEVPHMQMKRTMRYRLSLSGAKIEKNFGSPQVA